MRKHPKIVREIVGGKSYEYYPLGRHVVSAPAVCRGRPTFKYTRIEVAGVLKWLGAGHSVDELVANCEGRVSRAAVAEAAALAATALTRNNALATAAK